MFRGSLGQGNGRYLLLGSANLDLLLVRQLPPWHKNLGKRLVKSSKVYLRDSGLLHALLGIADKDSLLGRPVLGHSWEGFVWAIEVKRCLSPKPEKGFHHACTDLQPDRRFVVYPGQERYRVGKVIEAMPLHLLAGEVSARASR